MLRLTLLIALVLLNCRVFAQESALALKADRMLDVETGEIVRNVVIIIEKGVIKSVNEKNSVDGLEVLDLGDVTLLPGLIDMHTHLMRDVTGGGGGFNPNALGAAAMFTLTGVKNAKTTLLAGFTTVRDLGSFELVDIAMSRAINRGMIDGPRIIPSGYAISITGGHTDASGFGLGSTQIGVEKGAADGPDEILKAVRYQIKHGAKVIKIAATAGVFSQEASNAAQQMTYEEIKTAVEEAARHGVKVAAHAHGTEGIIAASNAGVASIEHASILSEEAINTLIENDTYIVPTAHVRKGMNLRVLPPSIKTKAEGIFKTMETSHRMAYEAGVKIAFGTDAAVIPHGDNAKEFSAYTNLGMSNIEAIRTATLNARELLGIDDRGIIEKAKLADIIAVRGNPLEDITTLEHTVFVMKGGTIYKNTTSSKD